MITPFQRVGGISKGVRQVQRVGGISKGMRQVQRVGGISKGMRQVQRVGGISKGMRQVQRVGGISKGMRQVQRVGGISKGMRQVQRVGGISKGMRQVQRVGGISKGPIPEGGWHQQGHEASMGHGAWGKWKVSLPEGTLVQYLSMMISKTSFKKYLNDSWIPKFPCSWNSKSGPIFSLSDNFLLWRPNLYMLPELLSTEAI